MLQNFQRHDKSSGLHLTARWASVKNFSNFMNPLTPPWKVQGKHGGFSGERSTQSWGMVQQVKAFQHRHEDMSSDPTVSTSKSQAGSTCPLPHCWGLETGRALEALVNHSSDNGKQKIPVGNLASKPKVKKQ